MKVHILNVFCIPLGANFYAGLSKTINIKLHGGLLRVVPFLHKVISIKRRRRTAE